MCFEFEISRVQWCAQGGVGARKATATALFAQNVIILPGYVQYVSLWDSKQYFLPTCHIRGVLEQPMCPSGYIKFQSVVTSNCNFTHSGGAPFSFSPSPQRYLVHTTACVVCLNKSGHESHR